MQGQRQDARTVALDRHTNQRLLVIDLDPPEGIVVLLLAFRQLGRAQLNTCRFGGEAEIVAVQVVALGDLETYLDRLPVERSRGRLECEQRRQQIRGVYEAG